MFAFRIKYQNTYILQQFYDSNTDLQTGAFYTIVFLQKKRDEKQQVILDENELAWML